MPTRKYRRTVDPRVASLARQLAAGAATDENLQEALLATAVAACMVSAQVQALLTTCKTAANAFAMCKASGDLADKSGEVFARLGDVLIQSSEGTFSEILETIVAMAVEALPAEQRLRSLISIATSCGLDPSEIALDYEEHTVDVPDPVPEDSGVPNIEYNAFSIDAFTEMAAVRRLSEIQVRRDPDGRFLVGLGSDGRTWLKITRLQCDDTEAQRVAEGVKNRLYRRMS